MNYQPNNQYSPEKGPEGIIIMRPRVVDEGVRHLEAGYSNSRTIKGMERVPIHTTIYDNFRAQISQQVGNATVPEAVRWPRISVLNTVRYPMRFAHRLVSKAFAVLPSVGYEAPAVTPVAVTEVRPVETTLQTPAKEVEQPAVAAAPIATTTLETVNVESGELSMEAIRAQIDSLFGGNHVGLN